MLAKNNQNPNPNSNFEQRQSVPEPEPLDKFDMLYKKINEERRENYQNTSINNVGFGKKMIEENRQFNYPRHEKLVDQQNPYNQYNPGQPTNFQEPGMLNRGSGRMGNNLPSMSNQRGGSNGNGDFMNNQIVPANNMMIWHLFNQNIEKDKGNLYLFLLFGREGLIFDCRE